MTTTSDSVSSLAERRTIRLILAAPLLVACIVSACSLKPRYGTLDGVVVRGRSNEFPDSAQLQVIRPSGVARPYVGMGIQKSDTVSTSHDTRARLTLVHSYEVTLDTGTVIVIENPSIFVRLGQLFIRKLIGSSDSVTVHTNHTTILDKGTSFFVRVRSAETAQVFVLEGAVTIAPRSGGNWPPRTWRAGQGATLNGDSAPEPMEDAAAALNTEMSWVRNVDSVLRVQALRGLSTTSDGVLSPDARTQPVRPPRPPAVDSTRPCRVPNILNRSEAEAVKLITGAGYVPRRRGAGGDYVATQTPPAPEQRRCGQQVIYTMATRVQ